MKRILMSASLLAAMAALATAQSTNDATVRPAHSGASSKSAKATRFPQHQGLAPSVATATAKPGGNGSVRTQLSHLERQTNHISLAHSSPQPNPPGKGDNVTQSTGEGRRINFSYRVPTKGAQTAQATHVSGSHMGRRGNR